MLTWLFTHMTSLECNSVEISDIYIVLTYFFTPPNNHAKATTWFVHLANTFILCFKCQLLILHILTFIYCRIVNDMCTFTR